MATLVPKDANLALNVAAASCRAWSRPTKCPVDPSPGLEVRRVYKPSPVSDWFVEKNEVEESVLNMYASMRAGGVKQLLAGTGCGKSTRIPLVLARQHKTVGIVVLPDKSLRRQLYKYISEVFIQHEYTDVAVKEAYELQHILKVIRPAVVYMAACDFLQSCATSIVDITASSVGFIYVDESHEVLPEYYVIKLMTTAKLFGDVKVLMGSATATGESLEANAGPIKRVTHAVKPQEMKFKSPCELTKKSPLFAGNIKDRTMIFVTDAADMQPLMNYYQENAIEVVFYSEVSEARKLDVIKSTLSSGKRPLAFLATQQLQTGYTFDVDTVVDCGVTVFLDCDPLTREVKLAYRKVSMSERIQRCGRVGRHMSGTAYYVDGDTSTQNVEVLVGYEGYVVLWCTVLGLEVNSQITRDGLSQIGSVTPMKAAVMLHSYLHPAVMTNYVDIRGELHKSLLPVCKLLFADVTFIQRLLSSQVKYSTEAWKNQVVAGYGWVTYNDKFRQPCIVPDAWQPILLVMYLLYMDLCQLDYVVSDDSTTVVTDTNARRSEVGYSNLATQYLVDRSDKTRRRHTRVESLNISGDTFVLGSSAGLGTEDRTTKATNVGNVEGGSGRRRRKYSHSSARSRGSSGDGVLANARLRRVKIDPTQLFNQRVFPMDDHLFDKLALKQGVVEREDVKMFGALVGMRVELAALSELECDLYFLVVVAQWNRVVLSTLQLKAKPLGIFERAFGIDNEADALDAVKSRAKRLLVAFHMRGRFVGIEASARQCVTDERLRSFDEGVDLAAHVLSVGNQYTRDIVQYLKYHVVVYEDCGKVRRGVFLRMNDLSLGVLHTFTDYMSDDSVVITPPKGTSLLEMRLDRSQDYVVFLHVSSPVVDAEVRLRCPVHDEMVLVVSQSLDTGDQVIYGPFKVFGSDVEWYYNGALPVGTSGSVLVACSDGCVVGFHVGRRYGGQEMMCSAFVPGIVYERVLLGSCV